MSARNLAPGPMDVPRGASSALLPARQYRDLCSTCNHVKACARSTPERPIFFCGSSEEFVGRLTGRAGGQKLIRR